MKCVRSLSNVIKHHGSKIDASKGDDHKRLVSHCGLVDGFEIAAQQVPVWEFMLKTYVFLDDFGGKIQLDGSIASGPESQWRLRTKKDRAKLTDFLVPKRIQTELLNRKK